MVMHGDSHARERLPGGRDGAAMDDPGSLGGDRARGDVLIG
jgi:hypothetical protein